jgi:hypothetical protein
VEITRHAMKAKLVRRIKDFGAKENASPFMLQLHPQIFPKQN